MLNVTPSALSLSFATPAGCASFETAVLGDGVVIKASGLVVGGRSHAGDGSRAKEGGTGTGRPEGSANREGWEAFHPSQPPALWAPDAPPG